MNPELVAQITKLVLERLSGADEAQSSPLTDTEMRRWGEISASIQRKNGGTEVSGVNRSMKPLNAEEVRRWNAITDRFGNQTTHSTGQVRFHSHT